MTQEAAGLPMYSKGELRKAEDIFVLSLWTKLLLFVERQKNRGGC